MLHYTELVVAIDGPPCARDNRLEIDQNREPSQKRRHTTVNSRDRIAQQRRQVREHGRRKDTKPGAVQRPEVDDQAIQQVKELELDRPEPGGEEERQGKLALEQAGKRLCEVLSMVA